MKLKKLLCIGLCIAMGVAGFAACATGEEKPVIDVNDLGQISVWSVDPLVGDYFSRLSTNPNDRNALMTKKIVEDFQKATVSDEFPEGILVGIENVGWGTDLNEKLSSAVMAGTMPDLTVGEQFVKTYINGGRAFQELTIDPAITGDLLDSTKSIIYRGDKLFAVPVWTGSFALNINKTALKNFGILDQSAQGVYALNAAWQAAHPTLNPLAPATWEELYEICAYIHGLNGKTVNGTKLSGVGGMLMSTTKNGAPWRALTFLRTAGGDMVDANNNVTMDTPANRKAFKMMRDFAGIAPDRSLSATSETSLWDTFFFPPKDPKAAYTVDGSDITSLAVAKGRSDDFAVAELPVFEEDGVKANVLVGTGYFSMSKTTKKQKACTMFLEYLLSPEIQELIMKTDNRIATRKSVLSADSTKELPNYSKIEIFMKPFMEGGNYEFQGGLPTFDKNPGTVWDYYYAFSNDLLKKSESEKPLDGIIKTAQSNMANAAKN